MIRRLSHEQSNLELETSQHTGNHELETSSATEPELETPRNLNLNWKHHQQLNLELETSSATEAGTAKWNISSNWKVELSAKTELRKGIRRWLVGRLASARELIPYPASDR
ncbi:hypothetical protein AVEN_201985-1 [Araneus ventricosus]|uniref:Uncharacterized protein n=1 Tax=Araneus ventricosus TaxID=182803 RepID=A0A4Y2KW64_ARAVE|nr:hypothetical protein AVEN_201985-1 [Araneus ventricosus]